MSHNRWLRTMSAVLALTILGACKTVTPAPAQAQPVPQANQGQEPKAAGQAVRAEDWMLLPMPRQMEFTKTVPLPEASRQTVDARSSEALPAGLGADSICPFHTLSDVDAARMPHPEGYEITIEAQGTGGHPTAKIVAHDPAGQFYAAQTLKQLAERAKATGQLPVGRIVDWPDFPNRGIMIDVARCKVPEMESLYELVDLMASWKMNQLQMYTEHTFAYTNHHVVWEDASPMTPAQIHALDAYCKERFIQLVPNQNSFGHMWRWLVHPEYAGLAETSEGADLCPVDPRSIELLRDMYKDLLPAFSSPYANVGCDETFTLGKGRSKAACEQQGVGRVYLGFLLQIHELVKSHGKDMQFWADIINNHPELIPELPKDITAMEWGYEANHPFAEHCRRFKENGVRFYVVPGTSSWNTLLGRHDIAMANLLNAAENGLANGGEGYLVTDWGDGGHWQFLPISYLGYARSAGLSWCLETNRNVDINRATDLYAFRDTAGVVSGVASNLGVAYKKTGIEIGNNTTFYKFLQHAVETPLADAGIGNVKASDLQETIAYIDSALAPLDAAKMDRSDADLIKAEIRMNAAMAKFACRLGIARINAGGGATSKIPKDVRTQLAAELEPLIPEYRQLWLMRNRSGGLKESAGIMENILALLKA